jgi:flagellar M-ring protein FliF
VNPEQLFAHLKKLAHALSAKQLLGLAAVFVAVIAVVVSSAYWMSKPDYALLVADMDSETTAAVVSRLKSAKVSYQLGDGGRSISVPQERLDELRLQFASDGLPSAGRLGFEIFDRPAFGTTEFLEHVNYRRALEGELARTIGTLSEVASARVHIAMAKDSLFVDREQPAKASVVLRLKANRPLSPATVKGIAGLVSASVESLRPEAVTILDTFGRFLSRPAEDASMAAGGAAYVERQQQVERDLSNRVIALLEPAVGAGRVRVNVSALLTADMTETTEERFDPASVVRSKQTSTETSAAASIAGGIAGARANQPPALSTSTANAAAQPNATLAANTATPNGAAPPANAPINPPAVPQGPGRTSDITNYEVSRTTRHTVTGLGQVARLSVAVIVDDQRVSTKGADGNVAVTTKPWEAGEIQRLQGLVAAAVGLNTTRGDQVTIENMSFEVPAVEPEPAAPSMGTQVVDRLKEYGPSAFRTIGILLVTLFALFGILRPLARRATAIAAQPALPAPAVAAARLPTISEMEGQIDDDGAMGQKRLPVLTKRVAKLASEEPEQLARIVRGWMAEDQR